MIFLFVEPFTLVVIFGVLSSIISIIITSLFQYLSKNESQIGKDIVIHTEEEDKVVSIKFDSTEEEIEMQMKAILNIIKPKVFLTYSSKDKDKARKIAHRLKQEGVNVWYDADIKIGEDWKAAITSAINESNYVLVLLSNNFTKSGFLKEEIEQILKTQKKILPMIIDEKIGEIPTEIARYHAVNYVRNPEESIDSIVNAINLN